MIFRSLTTDPPLSLPNQAFVPINVNCGGIITSSNSELAVASATSQLAAVGNNANERVSRHFRVCLLHIIILRIQRLTLNLLQTPMREGSYVALITPMTTTGKIDIPALRSILKFHIDSGTDGICILGTTGEASLLTMDERKTILDVAVEEVKGKIPILVGTGTIDPSSVKEQTLQAIDCGCDASLVVTPYYIKVSGAEVLLE